MNPPEILSVCHRIALTLGLLCRSLAIHLPKCERFRGDTEVHLLYERVARLRHDLVRGYAARMTAALATIIADGIALGEFRADLDPTAAAAAFRDALAGFLHPVLVAGEGGVQAEARLRTVVRMRAQSCR